jgi:DNA polymerase
VPDGSSLVYGQDTPIYSGKICENVVSATARDLLVEAILRLEGRGFKMVFHVHDEVIVEVEGSRKEIATSAVQEELSFVPPWATGLHVGCEVRETERYGK